MLKTESRSRTLTRLGLVLGVPLSIWCVSTAIAWAESAVSFNNGDVLRASDLNKSFSALEGRIAELENQSATLAGTFPAVLGLGGQNPDSFAGYNSCTKLPDKLLLDASVGSPAAAAFGPLLFTNGGFVWMRLGDAVEGNPCTAVDELLCAPPVTFFLVADAAQSLTTKAYLDDAGVAYLTDAAGNTTRTKPGDAGVLTLAIPKGKFALSFLACSVNGHSLGFEIHTAFIRDNPGLHIDFERTLHRNGK